MAIVWNMRVPRVLSGGFVGAGLAVCGCVLQSTVDDPISEPYILGVSAGGYFWSHTFYRAGAFFVHGSGRPFRRGYAGYGDGACHRLGPGRNSTDLPASFYSGTVVNPPFFCLFQFSIMIGGREFAQHHDDQILERWVRWRMPNGTGWRCGCRRWFSSAESS